MKKPTHEITINGTQLFYNIESFLHGDIIAWETKFYIRDGMVKEQTWSWRKLGYVTGKAVPNYDHVFTYGGDFHSPNHLKIELRGWLLRKIELSGRKAEIERGEII